MFWCCCNGRQRKRKAFMMTTALPTHTHKMHCKHIAGPVGNLPGKSGAFRSWLGATNETAWLGTAQPSRNGVLQCSVQLNGATHITSHTGLTAAIRTGVPHVTCGMSLQLCVPQLGEGGREAYIAFCSCRTIGTPSLSQVLARCHRCSVTCTCTRRQMEKQSRQQAYWLK